MKKSLLLFILCSFFIVKSFAQVDQIIGIARHKISVYLTTNSYNKSGTINRGDSVIIIDANDDYFTIKYREGNAYVDRADIKYYSDELKELKKTRKILPFSPKQIELNHTETKNIDDPYKYEIDHIRYCAGRYNREVMTGYAFSIVGLALSTSSLFMYAKTLDEIDQRNVFNKIGFGISIVGVLITIDSNKWMKRMNVGPDGIGIKYIF